MKIYILIILTLLTSNVYSARAIFSVSDAECTDSSIKFNYHSDTNYPTYLNNILYVELYGYENNGTYQEVINKTINKKGTEVEVNTYVITPRKFTVKTDNQNFFYEFKCD